jgi:thaumarchaeosortase
LTLLQAIVPTILYFLTFLLEKFGIPFLIAQGNILLIWGKEGLLSLAIYWPCAGVHSMLIYLLVITVVMMKLEAPRIRKLVYVISGAVGTFFVNILRLFLVCYYGVFISGNFWLFHETIGEALFLIWIVLFIVAIVLIERRLAPVRLTGFKNP